MYINYIRVHHLYTLSGFSGFFFPLTKRGASTAEVGSSGTFDLALLSIEKLHRH